MNSLKIEIELPGDLIAALNIPEGDVAERVKEWAVLGMFREGQVSAGMAAEILGMSSIGFLDLLKRRMFP